VGGTGTKGIDSLAGSIVIGQGEMDSSLKRMEKVFYSEGGKALEQTAQKCGGCPVPGDFQGKAQTGPDLTVDVPVCCGGVGLDGL